MSTSQKSNSNVCMCKQNRKGVAMAEVIRRAVEVYLVWNDPTYAPPPYSKKERRFHPHD